MPVKFNTDKELLEFVSEEGVGRAHAQGYFWFWQEFMPALKRARESSLVCEEIIADCYYVAGDVHDFNDAPKAAIKCYMIALKADPVCAAAYREIANMFGKIGKYDKALEYSDKALQINPDDEYALSDRDDYIGENRLRSPMYPAGDATWAACEFLARARPERALKTLRKVKGLEALRIKTLCYGAMQRTEEYLAAWAEIARLSDEIDFTYADWFFMEDTAYSQPNLWQILLASKAWFSGVFTVFDGLDENERYKSLSCDEKIRLRIEYHIYTQSAQTEDLKVLFNKYLEWIALQDRLKS